MHDGQDHDQQHNQARTAADEAHWRQCLHALETIETAAARMLSLLHSPQTRAAAERSLVVIDGPALEGVGLQLAALVARIEADAAAGDSQDLHDLGDFLERPRQQPPG